MTQPPLPAGESWYDSTARQRLAALLDAGSFEEFIEPGEREVSPHLSLFDLPEQFDDGMIVGHGRLGGRPVFVAAQEGRFMGGAIGEVHGAKLVGLLRAACSVAAVPVLILFDTGGVRLQEANVGELAIAEAMRAVLEARAVGVPVIGLIGGRAGCYGGGGLIAACCSAVAMSEQGRLSVSGPEVIETNRGIEEFDAKDRALIWRTMGGKHRLLLGVADRFVDDEPASFQAAAVDLIERSHAFALPAVQEEHARLHARLAHFGDCPDAFDIWRLLGVPQPQSVPDLTYAEFSDLSREVNHP